MARQGKKTLQAFGPRTRVGAMNKVRSSETLEKRILTGPQTYDHMLGMWEVCEPSIESIYNILPNPVPGVADRAVRKLFTSSLLHDFERIHNNITEKHERYSSPLYGVLVGNYASSPAGEEPWKRVLPVLSRQIVNWLQIICCFLCSAFGSSFSLSLFLTLSLSLSLSFSLSLSLSLSLSPYVYVYISI